jgi:hypothetical protein
MVVNGVGLELMYLLLLIKGIRNHSVASAQDILGLLLYMAKSWTFVLLQLLSWYVFLNRRLSTLLIPSLNQCCRSS